MRLLSSVLGETTKAFAQRQGQRAAVYAGVVAGHAVVAALLCWQAAPAPVPQAGQHGDVVAISLMDAVPAARPPRHPVPPQSPKPASPHPVAPAPDGLLAPEQSLAEQGLAEQTPQLSEAHAQAVADFAPAAGEPGAPCDLTQALATAFARSPAVQHGLDTLPASQRSVANAIMLWDGHWPAGAVSPAETLLRALLVKGVSTARPDCLAAVNTGPVLFLVPDRDTMVVLAVGSGEWRWGDLLDPADIFIPAANIENRQPPVHIARADDNR